MSANRVTTFNSYTFQADFFYKTIGMVAYDKHNSLRYKQLLDAIFLINIVNMNFVLLTELIYVALAAINNTNFVEATMNLSYIGFVFVGDIKILSIRFKKTDLTKLMQDMLEIYPKSSELQQQYGTRSFLLRYNLISFGFVIVHLMLVWTYNLFTAVSYLIYDYWLQQRVVERKLPYYCWLPWSYYDNWSYYVIYVSQNLAGHTCTSGQFACDLLLCVVVTQLIMHYQFLAKRIESHVAGIENQKSEEGDKDLIFLQKIIAYHQRLLHLCDVMNDVFGVPLLVNFISSSLTMCFLGFQITVGASTDTLVTSTIFLLCSLIQIYMICNYGQQLILSSEGIGHAVYKHAWQNANLRYKKMLVLIIKRSQKASLLKATVFLNISLGTMTDLLQLSYKFFALIRTMYSEE